MKKMYIKPALQVVTFELAEHIAACSGYNPHSTLGMPTHADGNNCAWDVGGVTMFLFGNEVCDVPLNSYEDLTLSCYNNPSGGDGLAFGS